MWASLSPAFEMFNYAPNNHANQSQNQEWDDGLKDVVGNNGHDQVTDDFVLLFMHWFSSCDEFYTPTFHDYSLGCLSISAFSLYQPKYLVP